QLHDRRRAPVQDQAALRRQQKMLLIDLVEAEAGGRGELRFHAAATASSRHHSISHLRINASTQRSCNWRVSAFATTKASASSESRRARGTRERKYSSTARSTHG